VPAAEQVQLFRLVSAAAPLSIDHIVSIVLKIIVGGSSEQYAGCAFPVQVTGATELSVVLGRDVQPWRKQQKLQEEARTDGNENMRWRISFMEPSFIERARFSRRPLSGVESCAIRQEPTVQRRLPKRALQPKGFRVSAAK